MRVLRVILLLTGIVSGSAAFAQSCPDFSGEYTNFSDAERPKIRIRQQGCDSIKFIDKENVEWTIPLNGTPGGIPSEFQRKMESFLSRSSIAGVFSQQANEEISLIVRTNMQIPLIPGRDPIEIEVQGRARALHFAKNIDIVFDEIKILSVVNGQGLIQNGETSGFLQGANWIVDIVKSALDIQLKEI